MCSMIGENKTGRFNGGHDISSGIRIRMRTAFALTAEFDFDDTFDPCAFSRMPYLTGVTGNL